jgi:hypothetical protein
MKIVSPFEANKQYYQQNINRNILYSHVHKLVFDTKLLNGNLVTIVEL